MNFVKKRVLPKLLGPVIIARTESEGYKIFFHLFNYKILLFFQSKVNLYFSII